MMYYGYGCNANAHAAYHKRKKSREARLKRIWEGEKCAFAAARMPVAPEPQLPEVSSHIACGHSRTIDIDESKCKCVECGSIIYLEY